MPRPTFLILVFIWAVGTVRGQAPDSLFRSLNQKLFDPDPKVRREAAKQVGDLGNHVQTLAAVLGSMLKDGDPQVRRAAAEALQRIGPSALIAVPDLAKALEDKDESVRRDAVLALGEMSPRQAALMARKAAPALTRALKDKDVEVRRRAAAALGLLGPAAKSAVPALIAAMQDPDSGRKKGGGSVSLSAIMSLANLGPDAREALPALRKVLQAADLHSRMHALRSLAKIAPHDETLLGLLTTYLNDKHLPLRLTAADGLGEELGPDAKQAVPDLLKALQAKDVGSAEDTRTFRGAVINALGEIGPAAKEAIPAIRAWTRNSYIGLDAQRALKRIQGSN